MEKKKNKAKNKVVDKAQNNKINYATTEQEEIRKFLIVILVVLVCVGGIYFCTRAFVTKDLFKKDNGEEEKITAGVIDYNVAIMGQLLNRPYTEYYAAIYNIPDGADSVKMTNLVDQYNAKETHLHIYTVDLSNELNKAYYDPENVNTKAKSLNEVKVGDITLIKVKDGKINKYIVDYEKMEQELGVNE